MNIIMCLSRKKIYHLGGLSRNFLNLINKHLARLFRRKRKDSDKIISEKGNIKTDATQVKNMIRDYKKQLHTNKLSNRRNG